MSQQSDIADAIHQRLAHGAVSVAALVREVRERWGPEHSFGSVHLFVEEVLYCLLRESDVDVACATAGDLVSWNLPADEAWEKISEHLRKMHEFLEDDDWCCLRKKHLS
ncbi:hypothetical protein [Prosthecobacter sp.]|uniref:hypothetical protein n=1 Tax=Prosthecobacter sp. TaxID=1965333 RepID=UPI003783A5BD